ncbi:hypothetical protein C9E85_01480 [Plesiomonas shigelloides]|uniref:hypothetical protein n=1 Tax=Plesiomonas shigelloides TaxID=703 RepID=UPI000D56B693|nr:hypothetical protein [Plesiomonas shigelloides]PVU67871.1 hypothetical protein C9E85_01480 [Plesiomonas shigelloides]
MRKSRTATVRWRLLRRMRLHQRKNDIHARRYRHIYRLRRESHLQYHASLVYYVIQRGLPRYHQCGRFLN